MSGSSKIKDDAISQLSDQIVALSARLQEIERLEILSADIFIVGVGPVDSIPISVLKAGCYNDHSFKGFFFYLK